MSQAVNCRLLLKFVVHLLRSVSKPVWELLYFISIQCQKVSVKLFNLSKIARILVVAKNLLGTFMCKGIAREQSRRSVDLVELQHTFPKFPSNLQTITLKMADQRLFDIYVVFTKILYG